MQILIEGKREYLIHGCVYIYHALEYDSFVRNNTL